MKVVSNQKEVLELIKKYRESLMVDYNSTVYRLIDVRIHENKRDIQLDVKRLKETYDLKRQTLLKKVDVVLHNYTEAKLAKVNFFTFFG